MKADMPKGILENCFGVVEIDVQSFSLNFKLNSLLTNFLDAHLNLLSS